MHPCCTSRVAYTSVLAKTLLWFVDPSQPSAYFGQVSLGLWWNLMRILWRSLEANANLSSFSSDEWPDFWCAKNWFGSDTHMYAGGHTPAHTHAHFVRCLRMTDPKLSWGQLLTSGKKCFGSEKHTEQNANELCYWSCDYNSYLLKTEKLPSKLHIGGWRHTQTHIHIHTRTLVCLRHCPSILRCGVRAAGDVNPGVVFTFLWQSWNFIWPKTNDKY